MRATPLTIEGAMTIDPIVHKDERGFFMETYRKDELQALGFTGDFVLDSHSYSMQGVIRGLHFQWDPPMAKIMRVAVGEVYVALVDIRKSSPTFRRWESVILSSENKLQLFIPKGCAVGFAVVSDHAEVLYKQSVYHSPAAAGTILWNDPSIGIDWPQRSPILSSKDKNAQTLEAWLKTPESDMFDSKT